MKTRIMKENAHENAHETTCLSQNAHETLCHERFHGFAHELSKNHHIARPSASQGDGRCAPAAFLPVLPRPPGGALHSQANNSNSIP